MLADKDISFKDGSFLQPTEPIDSIKHAMIDVDSLWPLTLKILPQKHK